MTETFNTFDTQMTLDTDEQIQARPAPTRKPRRGTKEKVQTEVSETSTYSDAGQDAALDEASYQTASSESSFQGAASDYGIQESYDIEEPVRKRRVTRESARGNGGSQASGDQSYSSGGQSNGHPGNKGQTK